MRGNKRNKREQRGREGMWEMNIVHKILDEEEHSNSCCCTGLKITPEPFFCKEISAHNSEYGSISVKCTMSIKENHTY